MCSCNSNGEKGEKEQQGSTVLVGGDVQWDREVNKGELLPKSSFTTAPQTEKRAVVVSPAAATFLWQNSSTPKCADRHS